MIVEQNYNTTIASMAQSTDGRNWVVIQLVQMPIRDRFITRTKLIQTSLVNKPGLGML